MEATARELWEREQRRAGARERLFRAVAGAVEAATVLYPGSSVDVAPSFVWPDVTYVDQDPTAAAFFGDRAGIERLLAERDVEPGAHRTRFLHADYSADLGLADRSFDLLISLDAGLVSDDCTRYLRPGGALLVSSGHGDEAAASVDLRYELEAVVRSRRGRFTVTTADLDTYLVPQRPADLTAVVLEGVARPVAYTRSPFAYLFRRLD